MQRRSFVTTAAVAGGLALGLIVGPTAYESVAQAQTPVPSASASASPTASAENSTSPFDSLRTLFLDHLATALNVERAALDDAITSAGTSTAADAVQQGLLTQEQADRLAERVQSEAFSFGKGGPGPGGMPGHHRGGALAPEMRQAVLDAAASTLNLSVDELQSQLRSGQTLAEIATEQGTTEQAVVDAALAAGRTQLDEQVAAGRLTQAQTDALYALLEEQGAEEIIDGPSGRGGPALWDEPGGPALWGEPGGPAKHQGLMPLDASPSAIPSASPDA